MPNEKSEVESLFSGADLTTLVDLQKFLADEVAQGAQTGVDLSRAFTPLTDGLGIHPSAAGAMKAGAPSYVPPGVEAVTEFRSATPVAKDTLAPKRKLAIPELDSAESFEYSEPPPPVPSATLGRRMLAAIVDQCFVLSAVLLALAITSQFMVGATPSNPQFIRAAWMEFGMIWFAYLTLSLGLLDGTLGMWVWGLRVNFGESGRFWKKIARVVMGMFFYPAIAPSLLLVFRKDGRHLIDAITQTEVYRNNPK